MAEYESIDLEAYTKDLLTFIACVLMDVSIIDSMKLRPEMCLRRNGQIVLEVITDQHRRGIHPDNLTIFDELLSRGSAYDSVRLWASEKVMSWDIASSVNWEFYETRLIDMWVKHKVTSVARSILEEAGKHSVSSGELLEKLETVQTEISMLDSHDSMRNLKQVLQPVFKTLETRAKLKNGELPGIKTGFYELDEKIMGLQRGQLVVIGARPGEGKSAWGGQVHRHTALVENEITGVLTIESSAEELTMRSLSAEAPVNASLMAKGRMTAGDLKGLEAAVDRMTEKSQNFVYFDKPRMTLQEVNSACRRMKLKYGVKVIFIDYLQRIRVPKQKTRFEEVAMVATGLKEIARELNIPIVAMAQLGRDADDKKPGMGDFQYSSQIEQDADVVILLWHQKYFEKVEKMLDGINREYKVERKQSWFLVEKVRDGETGDIPVHFFRENLTFRESAQKQP
jgi:replicative DNA helicase